MTRIHIDRPPRTDDELYELTKALWGVVIPRNKVCFDHQTPFEAYSTAFFAREPSLLIHGSRGLSGKSRLMSILGLTNAVVWGSDCNILGGSMSQSANVLEAMQDAWGWMDSPSYMLIADQKTEQRLSNRAKIRPLTASQKTVRGPHPARLLLDEIDEMDLPILDAALGQPMPQKNWLGVTIPAQTTMASTWQYADGTFTEIKRRFDEESLPVYTWCAAGGLSAVVTASGTKDITEVTTDDLVLTRGGYRPVQHVTYMGDKQCVVVETSDGRKLTLTGDHKVLTTNRGWVEASLLGNGDGLVVLGAGSAMTSSPGVDVGVDRRVGMSVGAVSPVGLLDRSATELGVGLLAPRSQVLRIDAGFDEATVVQGLFGDLSYQHSVEQPMSHALSVDADTRVDDSVPSLVGALQPDPAAVVVEGEAFSQPVEINYRFPHVHSLSLGDIHPTYDIGVEGEHEFTVNGVVVHNCFKDTANPIDGWLTQGTIDQKKREVPKEMWRVEYELGEPSIGNRAIDTDSVERMFDVPAPIPIKDAKEHQEYRILQYDFTRDYVIAADWAKEQDWTVISVWDATELPMRLAYYVRIHRRPYPVMVGMFNTLQQRYAAEGIHDATGLGGVVSDLIQGRARNFLMTGMQRDNMLSEFINAVEDDRIRASRIDSLYKACKYVSVDDLYSRAKEFHLPDEVCSAALAYKLVSRRHPAVAPFAGPKEDNNWMGKAVESNHASDHRFREGDVTDRSQEGVLSFT